MPSRSLPMSNAVSTLPETPPSEGAALPRIAALVCAMLLPTGVTLTHLVLLAGAGEGNVFQQIAYVGGTVAQFALPLVCFFLIERSWPRPGRPTAAGLEFGLQFGLAVGVGMVALYHGVFKDSPLMATTARQLHEKLHEFGI